MGFVLLLIVPFAQAGGTARGDPSGDQVTWVATFVGTGACRNPATDITHTGVSSDGTTLTISQTVVDLAGVWTCGGARTPTEQSSLAVFMQTNGGSTAPSLVVYRQVTRFASGSSVSTCHSIHAGSSTIAQCGVGSVSGNTVTWTLALRTPRYDLRGVTFDTIFGAGLVAAPDGWSYFALYTTDFNDLAGLAV